MRTRDDLSVPELHAVIARLEAENIELHTRLLRTEQIECDERAWNEIETKIHEVHRAIMFHFPPPGGKSSFA